MGIQATSFLLGLGAAWVVPLLTRTMRPLAVHAAVAGMGVFDEVRRLLAEQAEMMEDIAAEARARREDMLASAEQEAGEPADDESAPQRAPRRNGARRRAS
jgi:hypothetical protein